MYQDHFKETRKAIDHYSYAICEEIGRGFSSRVYKGRDENTSNSVAVKVIDMKMVKQSIHAILLKNEISALKSLQHRSILKLFDVFQTQNNTYIITELCDSGDLSGLIKKKGRLDEQEAIKLMNDIIEGLYEVNQKGFIHRDIKPANILIDKGSPKIADFGFAVQINSTDARQQGKHYNVGTPLYMSPQALRQQGHTEKGDVWAMGVMYFEMIFGQPPFTAHSEQALLSTILHHPLVIPSHPQISDASKDFIRRCLTLDENQRMRVRELATHQLISRIERPQFRVSTQQTTKDRSVSQGVRDFHSRPKCPTQIVLNEKVNKRCPSDLYHLPQPPLNVVEPPQSTDVLRSKSQKQILDAKKIITEAENENTNSQIAFDKRNNRRPNTVLQDKTNQIQMQTVQSSPVQSPIKFKSNNDVLFSQINFCRFLYKFSQQLMAQKSLALSLGLREKLLFLLSKNIAMKIHKLHLLTDRENPRENIFQLDDIELYRKSESFQKFSQAIVEYHEKYNKHFEKMYNVIQKQNLTQDKKFEALFDKDLNEFESFYFITQSYLRQCLNELKQDLPICDMSEIENFVPEEANFKIFMAQQLCNYLQLCHTVLAYMNDYKKFQKAIKIEAMVDNKQPKATFKFVEELKIRIHELVTK
ncbi:hypothetical protein pb186bvf_005771 [Paramecium bursaria]